MKQNNSSYKILAGIAAILIIVLYFLPVWWVALQSIQYPKSMYPKGIRINFKYNGVYNGCEGTKEREELAADQEGANCLVEMNAINHFIGMYHIVQGVNREEGRKYPVYYVFDTKKDANGKELLNPETGKPIEVDVTPKALKILDFIMHSSPYLFAIFVLMVIAFIFTKKTNAWLALIPAFLPFYFLIVYIYYLHWYGHHLSMHGGGAFRGIKPFMPTVFGEGKVAQFTTLSYPYYGFFIGIVAFILLIVAVLLKKKSLKNNQKTLKERNIIFKLKQEIIFRSFFFFFFLSTIIATSFAQPPDSFGNYYPLTPPYQPDSINLQPLIDASKPGDTIFLKPAIYIGPIVIAVNRLVIDGKGHAIIDGLGYSSVIFIEGDSIEIKNCIIQNSGGLHDKINAGVTLKGNYNTIENCRIRECLFGIDVFKSQHNNIIHNEISSLTKRSKALKGDAIRFWWAQYNHVIGNYWHDSRDMVVWYSAQNLFQENKGIGNRYGIHFMYSHNNRIQNNLLINNSVGVFLMYSERTIISGNYIMDNHRGSGMCLGMKETSGNQIINNKFIYSTQGIHIDVSPYVLEQINTIANNEIAFCRSAFFFKTKQMGNLIKNNYIHNNLSQVSLEATTERFNDWDNNYWDDYQGFDKNNDNVGDIPYRLYSYVEHLWDFNKNVQFFFGAPILAVLDFLERLAPFSEPKFVLEDKHPMYHWIDKMHDENENENEINNKN